MENTEDTLLNSAYKVFSKILSRRLEPLADRCIEEYHLGNQQLTNL